MNKKEELKKWQDDLRLSIKKLERDLIMSKEEKLIESYKKCTIAWTKDLAMHFKEYGIEKEDLPLFIQAIKNGFESIMMEISDEEYEGFFKKIKKRGDANETVENKDNSRNEHAA